MKYIYIFLMLQMGLVSERMTPQVVVAVPVRQQAGGQGELGPLPRRATVIILVVILVALLEPIAVVVAMELAEVTVVVEVLSEVGDGFGLKLTQISIVVVIIIVVVVQQVRH